MRIFDLHLRHEIVALGKFHCPKCNGIRCYEQKCVAKRSSWLLLGKEQWGAAYVECIICKQAYQLEVLQYNHSLKTDRLLLSTKYALETGVSVDTLLNGLIYSGMDLLEALQLINSAGALEQKLCPTCGIERIGSLLGCKQCSSAR